MFIEAIFTIAKTWNQPTCPSMDDWTKIVIQNTHTHTHTHTHTQICIYTYNMARPQL